MQRYSAILFAAALALGLWGCSQSTGPGDQAKVQGRVMRHEDSAFLPNANVLLYDAGTNSPVMRTFSDGTGNFSFTVAPGDYHLAVAAQGRIPSPPQSGRPIPFAAAPGKTISRDVYLDPDPSAASTGGISGKIEVPGSTPLAGVLIVADQPGIYSASTTTGPDGFYVLYNLPPGAYILQAFRSGLAQDTTGASALVRVGSLTENISLRLSASPGNSLQGKISFLASPNGVVDITLIHPLSRDAIPGLSTRNDTNNDYLIQAIPPGFYIAWASFRNDGYVMDPDRIHKFGLPTVSFPPDTNLAFDVTDAITVIGPTNSAEDLRPAAVNGLAPLFKWEKYSSAKEYILEVFDARGARIWGGFDSLGNILHAAVTDDSARFNFDGSAGEALKNGGIYSWKVYADNDATPDVQGLISSSEDLRGLFQIVSP